MDENFHSFNPANAHSFIMSNNNSFKKTELLHVSDLTGLSSESTLIVAV
jgi:hypothetical protein